MQMKKKNILVGNRLRCPHQQICTSMFSVMDRIVISKDGASFFVFLYYYIKILVRIQTFKKIWLQ